MYTFDTLHLMGLLHGIVGAVNPQINQDQEVDTHSTNFLLESHILLFMCSGSICHVNTMLQKTTARAQG